MRIILGQHLPDQRIRVNPVSRYSPMPSILPQRPRAHQLETESTQFFRGHLPINWTCDEPQHDYGVDLRIGITKNDRMTGQFFSVQLKASDTAPNGESVVVRLDVATLNYLQKLLEVVVLVKYIAAEKEAYWLFIKDAPQPKINQQTISVRIPRSNALSMSPWQTICEHVHMVHRKKLGVMHKPDIFE